MTNIFTTHLPHRISNKFRSFFSYKQWGLLVASGKAAFPPRWKHFQRLVPPHDHFWADPFIHEQEGQVYIFFEEVPFATNRGHISCLTLNDNLQPVNKQVVLQRPYHLSYPFLFEYQGQLYMLPESAESNDLDLYRCTRFPDRWERETCLLTGDRFYDATLLEKDDLWWMFVNVIGESGSDWDTLHLYYAVSPLSEHWTAHPANPIVTDIRSARPAGKFFDLEGSLIRPSQDSSICYGYATNFNRIDELSTTNYRETTIHTFKPPRLGSLFATHTWNQTINLTVIDAMYWRPGRKPKPGLTESLI